MKKSHKYFTMPCNSAISELSDFKNFKMAGNYFMHPNKPDVMLYF